MSALMDMYLSASDSISFPDILDIDIKSEIETLVNGHNDFSGFNFDMQHSDFDGASDFRLFSNSSTDLDFMNDDSNMIVDPNVVLPVISLSQNIRSPSPSLIESHLAFSPSTIKLSTNSQKNVNKVKKDLLNKLDEQKTILISKPLIKEAPKPTASLLTFRNAINSESKKLQTNISINRNRPVHLSSTIEKIYPKPAYSYSCLIAMALKNSRTGSLPVSEIYNFMCRHFPYFKTAPNGWKNSVRHNLSLNKCFEKIEKPPVNGTQRKGCLWAMNPTKISKMDEEVQKWSRKDPSAIRRAMLNPENLEPLERGEMKFYFNGDNYGDSCGSAESEEGSDDEQEAAKRIRAPEDIGEEEIEIFEETVKTEVNDSDLEVDTTSDFEVEVADVTYEDIQEDEEMLRMEVALAQKELFEYERPNTVKRRKTYMIHN